MPSGNTESELPNVSTTAALHDVNIVSQTPAATVNNVSRAVTEQKPSRRTDETLLRLNETQRVLPGPRQDDDDDPACQKNTEDTTLQVNGSRPVVSRTLNHQSRATASHFERQLAASVSVHGAAERPPTVTGSELYSYVDETRLQRPRFRAGMTSCSVTSLHHVTPPVTSPVSVIPVQSAMSGPSVDHSRETLWIDTTRAAVTPHQTTSPRSASISGAQVETVVVPVQGASDAEHCRSAVPVGGPAGINHSADELDQQVDVVVTKTGLALGFSIDGGKDSSVCSAHKPITVKKVFRGNHALVTYYYHSRL